MKDQLGVYIDKLFAGTPKTSKVNELKEELLADLCAKYDDLIAQGRSEQDAYNIAIGGIGDINELLKGFENDKIYNYAKKEEESRRSAILVSTSIGLYILSGAVVILFGVLGDNVGNDFLGGIGCVIMFLIAAVATALLVFNGMTKSKYQKEANAYVEHTEEQSKKIDNHSSLYKSIVATLWPVALIIFLMLGMFIHLWKIAWVIFVFTAAVQNVIKLLFVLNDPHAQTSQIRKISSGILWPTLVTIYFLVSLLFGGWPFTWIIFIIGAAIEALFGVLFELRGTK